MKNYFGQKTHEVFGEVDYHNIVSSVFTECSH